MLKYLFTAYYKDGSIYQQNAEDVSISDPKRSCFFDLRQEEIARFSLVGDGHNYTVDLTDGHFEVDGIPFRFHESPLTIFRLVFWRQHTHEFNLQYQEKGHEVVYRFGWQTTLDGKNIQQVMEID